MQDKSVEGVDVVATDAGSPSNLQDAVTNLLDQLGKSSISIGNIAARELAVAVAVASDVRDNGLNEKVLAESRDISLLSDTRKTAHSIVDLGFDLAGFSVHTLDRSLRMYLTADRQS